MLQIKRPLRQRGSISEKYCLSALNVDQKVGVYYPGLRTTLERSAQRLDLSIVDRADLVPVDLSMSNLRLLGLCHILEERFT